MKRFGGNLFLICVLFVVGTGLASAQDAGITTTSVTTTTVQAALESRVFAVNLWNSAVDLKLGSDGIFVTQGLSGNMASQMVVFRNFNPRSIFYKASSADTWAETRQADGKTLNFAIQGGKIYLLLVQANGSPGLYELSANLDTTKPKLAVFNATNQTLPSFQIGTGFNQGTVVTASNLGPAWTNFVDVSGGNYGGFWTYPVMPPGIAYFYTSGHDGKTLGLTPFSETCWYVAILWQDSSKGQSGGVIWDISPKR